MEINKEIYEILKEFKIDRDAGVLVLLGIYYKLDIDTVCPEEVVKAINTTKIVEKDYRASGTIIKWNIPLFYEQQTEWGWVNEWNNGFAKINPERKDNLTDVTKRMQDFFSKNPKYRLETVIRARNAYFKTIEDPKYLKSSAKFIYEGIGASKISALLKWCEIVEKGKGGEDKSQMAGRVIS